MKIISETKYPTMHLFYKTSSKTFHPREHHYFLLDFTLETHECVCNGPVWSVMSSCCFVSRGSGLQQVWGVCFRSHQQYSGERVRLPSHHDLGRVSVCHRDDQRLLLQQRHAALHLHRRHRGWAGRHIHSNRLKRWLNSFFLKFSDFFLMNVHTKFVLERHNMMTTFVLVVKLTPFGFRTSRQKSSGKE